MSGRGRGRGRGGGYGGYGGNNNDNLVIGNDVTRPPFFPDILLHSSGDNRLLELEKKKKANADNKSNEGENNNNPNDDSTANNNETIVGETSTAFLIKLEDGTLKTKPKRLSGTKRSAATVALISKGREMHYRMRNSVFYVRPTKDLPDVKRFSASKRPPPRIDASAVLSHCLGGRTCTELGRFVPQELSTGQKLNHPIIDDTHNSNANNAANNNTTDLDANNNKDGKRRGSMDGGEDDDDNNENNDYLNEEEEEEDGEDYVTNYYESEGEESAGGDGEPTF
mmetsp:Transcript_22670/g.31981  ORF Transcript_22670/g.31981 Transcript_22670/m.31981 type:complete len:282 (-) Transcript_22670:71-916(-)